MYFLDTLRAELRSALYDYCSLDLEPSWEQGKKYADFSTNFALQVSRLIKKDPGEIAAFLSGRLNSRLSPLVKAEVAHPGFLNFYLEREGAVKVLREIFERGRRYGHCDYGKRVKVNVEFCSANPTGPIHLGNARGACIGHVLSNLLSAVGYDVTREYYFDDCGTQVEAFALSVEARYQELLGQPFEFPENGYYGEYVRQIASQIAAKYDHSLLALPKEQRIEVLKEEGLEIMKKQHRQTLSNLGIEFGVWYHQSSLKENWLDQALSVLKDKGCIYEKDGALWFASTRFGDDKDRVVIRSNGEPTYFAWDIAYNLNKVSREFEIIIDIWGPDHHGYVPRNKAAFEALGYNPDNLILIIYQVVKLYEGGQEVSMSKRTGEFITLNEVVEEVGKDAAIFFLINCSIDSNLEFDLDLAKERSLDNPVYYVQYAYTRALSIEREAQSRGKLPLDLNEVPFVFGTPERKLVSLLTLMPEEILKAAVNMAPLRLANFARDLAASFHSFYHDHRVLGSPEEVEASRLILVQAIRLALANILQLLGISAPEKM